MTPLFLLGAGFNKDAKNEAGKIMGHSIYKGDYEIECGYPLVNELYKICFPDKEINSSVSIESLFADSIQNRELEPLRNFYNTIMKADYFIINKLLSDQQTKSNCYDKFFKHFQTSSFLTFNYDSLSEIILFKLGCWFPHDGYGVPVETEMAFNASKEYKEKNSNSLVIHLHGSFCIYTHDIIIKPASKGNIDMIEVNDKPEFIFDPDTITDLFHPYTRPKTSEVLLQTV